jgi:hypothetical protein
MTQFGLPLPNRGPTRACQAPRRTKAAGLAQPFAQLTQRLGLLAIFSLLTEELKLWRLDREACAEVAFVIA